MCHIIFKYIVLIAVLLIIWSFIERKWIRVTQYQVKTKKWDKKVKPTKIIVLADLHNCTFGYRNEKLIDKIQELNPDIVLVAGDMITKQVPSMDSNAYYLLENLTQKYPVYYGYGNHEQTMEGQWKKDEDPEREQMLYQSWIEYKQKLSQLGAIFLDNEMVHWSNGKVEIALAGVSIGKEFFRKKNIPSMERGYIGEQLENQAGDRLSILSGHNPVYFKEYADWGGDLIFAGHIHGGMVRLPILGGMISPQVKFFPKYDWGKFEQDGSTMIVSRGLGSHSIMPRLFNPPELICVTVSGDKGDKV